MSKSIQDYRNIIKILKLQLLKIRQENATLSHQLGIASETQTSSFTPKINHYKDSSQPFAKNVLSFLLFAHRCEIIGVTPEMVFRIADKSRDKKVGVGSFSQILKRLKLRMSQTQISQFTNLIKKDNHVFYQDYVQSLSAFQVNSEKYPAKGSRTYVQLCLLKFGQEAKQFKNADNLYERMNNGQNKPYLTFQSYTSFVRRNMPNLQQYELIAVFVGLDLMSQCQIQKSVFKREVGKVYSLLERGLNIEQQLSSIIVEQKQKQPSKIKPNTEKSTVKKETAAKKSVQATSKEQHFDVQEERGDEAGNKKKPIEKKPNTNEQKGQGKDVKLSAGNSKKIVEQLKKQGIRIGQFLEKLLNQQSKKGLVRSFTIYDFSQAAKSAKKDFPKKKIIQLFKQLDTQKNGTIDTAQILKLWIRAKQLTDSDQILYRLLYRHLREIQYSQPSQKFEVEGASVKETLNEDSFKKVFQQLQLQDLEVQKIVGSFIGNSMPIEKFCEKLKSQGKPPSTKKFAKMDANLYNEFKSLLKRINDKRGGNSNSRRWRKLMRLQETGEKSTAEDYWQTIFTDEWACWQYCLEISSKLQNFWRDPQFGPSKSDPSGIRSIVGNESSPPPALPDESEIQWLTFEQLLLRKKIDQKVTFMETSLNPNHVVQGNIGDCWYVSSLSIIATQQQYIKGLPFQKCKKEQQCATFGINPYLFKFFIKYGIYVFKYFKKFQPVYVVVDDLFPVQTSTNEFLFAKSPNPGMQWVAFLQKSYAKLHHAYSNMISGDISQGLNDLTNALPIKQNLQKDKKQENLQKIKRLNSEQQMMGCSITPQQAAVQAPVTLDDQKCGLFYSHAYSIIDFLDLNTNDRSHFDLIRVRNPWGHGQWLLDWSDTPIDNNPQYQKNKQYQKDITALYEQKKKEAKKFGKLVPNAYQANDDGQFLMNFEDFNNLYTNLFTGFTVDSFNAKYQGRCISQKWDSKAPSGICKLKGAPEKDRVDFAKNNHQYILQVDQDDTDILMYIVQQDGRLYRGQKYPYKQLCNPTLILSFTINNDKQLTKFDEDKLTFKSLTFERRREVNLWSKFNKGKYAIIPCKMKNNIKESDFEFRIYSQKSKSIRIKKVRASNDFKLLAEMTAPQIDASNYNSFLDLLEKSNKK